MEQQRTMVMKMKSESPWEGLSLPSLGSFSAKRADSSHPFDFFHALNSDGQLMLILQLGSTSFEDRSLPRLKGLKIQWVFNSSSLQLTLVQSKDADLFALLCRDLVGITYTARSDTDCLDLLCTRLLKWQRLLSKGGPRLLTEHEIRGLFAELTFLQEELLPRLGPVAVEAWKGPSDFPQDFAIDNKVFEVKSHLVGAPQTVRISSITQLWVESADLYLCVYHLSEQSTGGKSLASLIENIRLALSSSTAASEEFEEKLASLGYLDMPDYYSREFSVVQQDVFAITENFPRIVPSILPSGICEVNYGIQLAALYPFQITLEWGEV